MSVPVFITYRDRRTFLDRTLKSYFERGFTDITVIDNDSETPLVVGGGIETPGARVLVNSDTWGGAIKVIRSDNEHRQLAPWLIPGLIPDDSYYIVADCDIELDCPDDVERVLIEVLEQYPKIEKVGLGIRVDDLLFPPPDHYAYSYLMEYSVERGTRFKHVGAVGTDIRETRFGMASVIDAPVDTHFAMHRPGHGWPGIVGARTTAPYVCRHLPWYEPEYTDDEKLYYARAGRVWAMGHSADSLLETTVAVPFTELRAETVAALTGVEVRYAPMLYDEGYWELLRDLWAEGRPFAIVEHDIVVRETTIDELKSCERDWCAMPFPYRGEEMAYSLACTRFSADLIARHPDLMTIVEEMWDDGHPARHWCRLDMWIFGVLSARGEKRHEHSRSEPVGHIGPQYPKHGCL